ncbi:transmembrane protein (macronuclear) [Tetrahymena thermophila SB210]|uniref:Transmembrane protein n=1 Tax=Tetrahymena thermophila (strain SB210) TaxID=312017 RepID=Q235U4_TETTS|nr:transmembrane protein [Tetrahymena thermophila SB210]EAR92304.2 transmembrane protein [Tetrahymena thermophila SB210]|eukprot:XP_001012549.2 transmembrane protein [Tetrahymena thermophila SB210]
MQNSTEINLANFNDGDVSQSFNYSNQWWNIPYEYEDRYNTNDSQQLLIICVIAIENNIFKIFIAQLDTQEIKYSYSVQDSKITNAVNDPFRQLILLVNNQGQTLVFNYSLKLIKIIQNSCLKQAKISFDSYFIYSICPNDIIIYNGLSFQQQYPKIQSGLKEVTNIVNIQYDNLFIITQKLNSLLVKLSFNSQYELIQIIDQEGMQLSKVELNKDSNNNIFLEMLFSSYRNIFYQIIPLSKKQSCNIEILQQIRPLENIYFLIELSNSLNTLQSSQQKLSVFKINYLDQQYIQSIDLDNIQEKNIDPNKLLSLVIQSSVIFNNIYWSKNQINSQNIRNVLINNMSLNIIDSITLNQNAEMKNFQLIDIILNVENTLNISNFDQVYLQNIKFNSKKLGNNQIIISNNKLVIIENITIDSIQTEQLTFYLSDNVNLVIKQIFINKLSKNNIFQIQNNQYIDIQDIQVFDAILISVFQISLCLKLNITNIYLKQVNSTQLLYLQGIAEIQVSQITVNSSNQVKILTIEPFYEKNIQYTCLSDVIQCISVLNSKEVSFDIQASNTSISDFYIYQSSISKTCFQVQSTNLVITNFKIEEVQPQLDGTLIQSQYINNNKYVFLQIFDFQNCIINNLTSLNNQITVLSINQQPDNVGNFTMNFSRLSSQEINEPLIELNFVDTILFNEVLIENNVLKQNLYTSIAYVSQCNSITINNSQFKNNTNFNGIGGSLYVFNCLHILIQNSIFKQNKCLRLNGGAISIQNFVNIAQVNIQKCQFILNSAAFSTGGAINLSYANLIIENSNVTSNTAIIGGGIYYEQVIPDFVLEKSNNISNNKNKIINNYAKIFGHNIGSTIRKIDIDLKNIKIPKGSVKILGERQIEIREFKSGNQITFEGIQLLDEENNPIKMSNINITEFQFYSSDIQSFVQSLSVSLNWDQSNKKIQVIGQVQSKQVINNGINLQSQIMYMPQRSMSLQIVLDTLPNLIDSKRNTFFLQDQFQKNFTINFTSCSIGEITVQQIDSIICQECPKGKYSLDQYSTSCKQCPDSAKECHGSTINLKNGYWRENNKTDIIIYCNKNPEFCQAESPDSKVIFFFPLKTGLLIES